MKRASTLLHKWSNARRRIERRIGNAEVQRIINRLSARPAAASSTDSSEEN